jgi:WhiB family redox-sensing transcriptional regulator
MLMPVREHAGNWRAAGACLRADPDLFFPISPAGPGLAQIARAKAICATCQVRRRCLEFALDNGPIDGIWGGTTPEERQRARTSADHQVPAPANRAR